MTVLALTLRSAAGRRIPTLLTDVLSSSGWKSKPSMQLELGLVCCLLLFLLYPEDGGGTVLRNAYYAYSLLVSFTVQPWR
jgi:hypothetical protein